MKASVIYSLMTLSLAACGSSATAPQKAAAIKADTAPAADANAAPRDLLSRVGALPAQELAPGQCGLFLWLKGSRRTLVYFADTASAKAHMRIDGTQVQFDRTEATEARPYGLFDRQQFSTNGFNLQLAVVSEARPGLTDGAVIPRGTLRLKEDTGWEVILPVAGLLGCQPKADGR